MVSVCAVLVPGMNEKLLWPGVLSKKALLGETTVRVTGAVTDHAGFVS